MKEYSVTMALADFIPVALFILACIILTHALYGKMKRGEFVLFSGGVVAVSAAGLFKALYKLLYALGVCDFAVLSDIFMPLQGIGFVLAGAAVVSYVYIRRKKAIYAAPPVFAGTFLFVGMMVLGLAGMDIGFARLAKRKGRKGAPVLFILSLIGAVCMGYLSSRDFTKASLNWLAEGVNIFSQGCLFLGAMGLHRGLKKKKDAVPPPPPPPMESK